MYLDEKLLGTPRLKSGWHRYDFALPASGIALGEHSVRLWFRKLGKVGSRVTPGALGRIELSKKPGEFSEVWMTSDSDPVWRAGPPTSWALDLVVPQNARIEAKGRVLKGDRAKFSIHLSRDGGGSVRIASGDGVRDQDIELAADLSPWAGQVVRLSLRTQGPARALGDAIWTQAAVEAVVPEKVAVSPVKNIVVLVAPGLWAHGLRTRLAEADPQSALTMMTTGAVTDDTRAGGIRPEDIHQRILDIRADNLPWVKVLQNEGEHRFMVDFKDFGRNIRQGFTSVHSSDSSPPDFNDVFDGIHECLPVPANDFFSISTSVESGKRSRVLEALID